MHVCLYYFLCELICKLGLLKNSTKRYFGTLYLKIPK